MTRRKDYRLNLQRFADAGEGTQDAAGTGESTQQDAAANETRVSFEDLIKGDYKDDYEKSIKQAIGRRMQGARQNEAKLAKIAPIMQALASKYGVTDPEDIDSIAKYVDEDESLYEDAAYQAGMSVDQYKRMAQIEAENQRLLAERQRNEQRRNAQVQYAAWQEEAKAIQADFPNFDLDTYLQDARFQTLLREGISLRNAYIAMDADNVLPEVIGYTAQQVGKKTAATIAQRGSRPIEGGISRVSSGKAKTDVSKLSNAEIEEYVRRARSGEVITFA